MPLVLTIEGARRIAEGTGKYAGRRGPFWCGRDGKWHDTWPEGGPVAVKMGVCRSDLPEPVWIVVDLRGTYREAERDEALLANEAELRALYRAFPEALEVFIPQATGEGEP